jgi:hypothetical protein
MTNTLNTNVVADLAVLSESAGRLLARPGAGVNGRIPATLAAVCEAIEAIPPTVADLGLMAHLRNRVRAALTAFKAGELGAARYEMGQLHRKLARLIPGEPARLVAAG